MTTPQDPIDPWERGDPDSPLTGHEEQEVSAVLADALGQGPVAPPAEVVSRLDDVLAGLVAAYGRAVAAGHGEEDMAAVYRAFPPG